MNQVRPERLTRVRTVSLVPATTGEGQAQFDFLVS
jgi:hypothetical protein